MTYVRRSKGRVSYVDEIVHMTRPSHGIPYFLHDFFHLVNLLFQVWHPPSDSAFGLVFSFNATLCPHVL